MTSQPGWQTITIRILLGSTKNKITNNKNGENIPHLEITEVILVHCIIVNIHYQQNSRVLDTFVSNKSFGQLLDISSKNFKLKKKTFDSELPYTEVWFTDENSKPLEIANKINITLLINSNIKYKKTMRYSVQTRDLAFVKGYGFLPFAKNIWAKILVKIWVKN